MFPLGREKGGREAKVQNNDSRSGKLGMKLNGAQVSKLSTMAAKQSNKTLDQKTGGALVTQ